MNFGDIDWKKGILAGLVAGICWGWLTFIISRATDTFPQAHGLLFNLATFATGGAVYGIVVGGLLAAARDKLPFKSLLAKAVMVSVLLWLVLRIAGAVLSGIAPWRYHYAMVETAQGFFLSIAMGALLSIFWKKL